MKKHIFPQMRDAGIEEPKTYFEKLVKLYNSKPQQPIMQEVTSWEDAKSLAANIEDIQTKNSLNSILSKKQFKSIIKKPNPIIYISIGTTLSTLIPLMFGSVEAMIVIFPIGLCVALTMYFITRKKFILQEKNNIRQLAVNEINAIIKSKNDEHTEYDNKIKKFEEKRLVNFNPSLEYCLEVLSEEKIRNLLNIKNPFKLQFHAYPSEYQKFRDEQNESKVAGTEIFDDL